MKLLTIILLFSFMCSSCIAADNPVLILHFNGTDASTPTASGFDSSPSDHTPTWVADAQLDTSDKKFGTASLLLDGDGDYITFPDSTDWDLHSSTSNTWTVSFFIRTDDDLGRSSIMEHSDDGNNFWFFANWSDSNKLALQGYSDGSTAYSVDNFGMESADLADDAWHHIAYVMVDGDVQCYLDGDSKESDTLANTDTFADVMRMGVKYNSVESEYFTGRIDEVWIMESNYFGADPTDSGDTITVPTGEYSTVVPQLIVTVMN